MIRFAASSKHSQSRVPYSLNNDRVHQSINPTGSHTTLSLTTLAERIISIIRVHTGGGDVDVSVDRNAATIATHNPPNKAIVDATHSPEKSLEHARPTVNRQGTSEPTVSTPRGPQVPITTPAFRDQRRTPPASLPVAPLGAAELQPILLGIGSGHVGFLFLDDTKRALSGAVKLAKHSTKRKRPGGPAVDTIDLDTDRYA
ncbi:hypothetical protein V8E36_001408 [Tilletia maclaganii]